MAQAAQGPTSFWTRVKQHKMIQTVLPITYFMVFEFWVFMLGALLSFLAYSPFYLLTAPGTKILGTVPLNYVFQLSVLAFAVRFIWRSVRALTKSTEVSSTNRHYR